MRVPSGRGSHRAAMTHKNDRVMAAFDPERFRREGHALVEQLADYLMQAQRGDDLPVLPWAEPEARLADWPGAFTDEGAGDFPSLMARVLAQSNHLHHPRYVGHQVTAPLPLAALCELASALLNNGMAVYEMGPAATAMEHAVLRFLQRTIGFPDGANGLLTSGGSVGNLTALLAARQAKAPFDVWRDGAHAGPPLCVLASEQTHYCVKRAVQAMGLGARGVEPVEVDARYRLRPDALEAAHARATANGRQVIAVVASAGSTSTGAFDPLEPIADFCAARQLWLHVDGAHGASAALSPRERPRLAGIERADSVVWDLHKMMLQPALVTAVLFRDGQHAWAAFAQEAAYLFSTEKDARAWDFAQRTLECTKRMMSLKAYAALELLGVRLFREYLEGTFDLARRFAARIVEAPDFELATPPDCNIVCFRLLRDGVSGAALDALQARARRRLVEDGRFYLVQTTLDRGVFLRVTLINPLTSDGDLDALLDGVRATPAVQVAG